MAETKNKGWIVTAAGTGINLALGILYSWSVIKGAIAKGGGGAFDWDPKSLNDPYAVCCLVFAFTMILAGRCQDKFGPRVTAFGGGVLVGLGFLWISESASYLTWVLGFGVLVGAGLGFGYSAATPAALKWFPPRKTGLIAGLVVSGFGLASVYIAPLSNYLLSTWTVQETMLFFGVAFLIVVCLLSLALQNPPPGYVPAEATPPTAGQPAAMPATIDATPSVMIKTGAFYVIWAVFFIGAGAGLMVIGSVAGMAGRSLGSHAFIAVALLAVGNASGRIVAGVLSDRIGRLNTLVSVLAFQAILMVLAVFIVGSERPSATLVVLLATLIGFNYGTNLSLFPSLTKDRWGLKHFGVNYGIVFTAWGVGGFVLGRTSQMLQAQSGSFTSSFLVAAGLLVVGALLALTLRSRPAGATVSS